MTEDEFNKKFAEATKTAEEFMMDPKSIQRAKESLQAVVEKNGDSDDQAQLVFMSQMTRNYIDKLIYTLLKDSLVD